MGTEEESCVTLRAREKFRRDLKQTHVLSEYLQPRHFWRLTPTNFDRNLHAPHPLCLVACDSMEKKRQFVLNKPTVNNKSSLTTILIPMISMTLTETNYPENKSIKHCKLPSLENPWSGFAGSHSQPDSLGSLCPLRSTDTGRVPPPTSYLSPMPPLGFVEAYCSRNACSIVG